MSTNAQLTQQINDLLAAWNEREAQFRAWLAGTPTGGPNSDGRYPLTDASGSTQLVDCPAKLSSTVEGPAGLSVAARLLSEAARDTAIEARDRAITAEAAAITMNAQTLSHRNLALTYRNEAAAFAAGLSAAQTAAVAAKVAAEVAQGQATQKAIDAASSEANAAASASAAAASAAAAATFDPSSYYTKAAADARYKPIAYVPSWAEITGKPTTFTPSAHSHVIADVTGLQTALDGKQAAGSYAAASHTHTIANITGLQTALDGKQAAGSYAAAVHGHVIGDITGLQAALDGKQAVLGFTPVQQGGGTGQGTNKVYVGWLGSQLGMQVDTTNFGGTWPINVSGTAAVASSLNGSTFSATGDFRAPIFYDSNDTNYFCNPAGTSRLSSALIGSEETFLYNDTGSKLAIRTGASPNYKYFRFDSDGGFYALNGAVRGSIFYDIDDSGYYCDPNGTSVLNTSQFNGTIAVGQAINSTWRIITNGTNAIYLNGGGYGQAEGSWRAPVFYDSDDTGYYLNPNGTSNLNEIVMAGLLTGRSCAGTDVNVANDTGSFSVRGSSTTIAAMSFHRTGAYAMNMGLGTDNVFRIGGWSASSNAFQMDGGGNLTMLGNVTAYSDARLKKDVETIGGALDIVQQLRGVRYTRIDSGQRQVGVIAQETQKVVPEVVQQGIGDDDTLSVAYGNLVGVLIEAIKELRVEVETLKGNNE